MMPMDLALWVSVSLCELKPQHPIFGNVVILAPLEPKRKVDNR